MLVWSCSPGHPVLLQTCICIGLLNKSMRVGWPYAVVMIGWCRGGLLKRLFSFFLQIPWTSWQLRSEKETRNKLIEADMNGKPQSRLFPKYVFPLCCKESTQGVLGAQVHVLAVAAVHVHFMVSFKFELSQYHLNCFLTSLLSGRPRSGAGAWTPASALAEHQFGLRTTPL